MPCWWAEIGPSCLALLLRHGINSQQFSGSTLIAYIFSLESSKYLQQCPWLWRLISKLFWITHPLEILVSIFMSPCGHLILEFSSDIWDPSPQRDRWFWGWDIPRMPCGADLAVLTRNGSLAFSTAAPMKLSRYTEMIYIVYSLALHLGSFDVIIYSSRTWWGRSTFLSIACFIRPRPVLVAAQNYSGIYYHPICSNDGITNRICLSGGSGITYAKLHLTSSSTRILHNPSNRSILESMKISSVPTDSMKCRSRWKSLPISLTAMSGDRLSFVSLKLDWIGSAPFLSHPGYTGEEKSKTIRPGLFFFGTTAIGDTFNFWGLKFFTSSQRKICKNPASIWYCISSLTVAAFSGSSALRCGPQVMAYLITSHSQSGTQLTGTT